MLNDEDIREALLFKIDKENKNHNYRIINELGVCDGIARVDIAVANGRLCGYEIKSDKDTLERLPGQISAYNKTFDKITIVVGKKYEEKIKNFVPEYWGIQVAYLNRFKRVSFKNIRSPKINKDVEAKSLLELLWKDELAKILKEKGVRGISNKNRRKLREIAGIAMPLNEIKNYTRETLKFREGWRADL